MIFKNVHRHIFELQFAPRCAHSLALAHLRGEKDKRALIRAVKSPQGEVSLDFTGKKPGRGAYVCPNSECLKRARKSRALERALDTAIPESVYEEMEKEMANGG